MKVPVLQHFEGPRQQMEGQREEDLEPGEHQNVLGSGEDDFAEVLREEGHLRVRVGPRTQGLRS